MNMYLNFSKVTGRGGWISPILSAQTQQICPTDFCGLAAVLAAWMRGLQPHDNYDDDDSETSLNYLVIWLHSLRNLNLRDKYPKQRETTFFLLFSVTNGEFFFTVLFFYLSHLTRGKEPLIAQKKKTTEMFSLTYSKVTFSAGRKSSKRRILRGFGPSPIFVQVLQKNRPDGSRMLNTGALSKTNTALQHSLACIKKNKTAQLHRVFTYFSSVHNGYLPFLFVYLYKFI